MRGLFLQLRMKIIQKIAYEYMPCQVLTPRGGPRLVEYLKRSKKVESWDEVTIW